MKKFFLVTGGFGLLGVSLVNFLIQKKFTVVILDYKNYRKNFFFKNKNIVIEKGNFCDKKFVEKIFKKYKFSGIFHLGAQTQVLKALKNPYETLIINILGTINFLEIMRKRNLKIPFIYSSSDKAYGELKKDFYLENDKLNAIFPYDTSKSSSDLICQSYSKTYKMNVGIIRSANIFGPNDFNIKRIVPETIISILSNKKLIIRSSGKQKRDYIFVEDVTRAYFKLYKYLAKKNGDLKIYNIGSKYNLSTIQIITKIYKIMKINLNFEIKNFSKSEINNQRLNYSKIKKELKWKPVHKLDVSLKKTIDWYTKNFTKFR
jgi:dTDP-glucose 4,6-dehydratase